MSGETSPSILLESFSLSSCYISWEQGHTVSHKKQQGGNNNDLAGYFLIVMRICILSPLQLQLFNPLDLSVHLAHRTLIRDPHLPPAHQQETPLFFPQRDRFITATAISSFLQQPVNLVFSLDLNRMKSPVHSSTGNHSISGNNNTD